MRSSRIPVHLSVLAGFLCAVHARAQSTWRTDSLMTTWPVQDCMYEIRTTLGRGVVKAVDTDDLYAQLQREAPGIPVFADSNVVLYTDLYGGPLRHHLRVMLGMSAIYFPMIEKELALQGLPSGLKFLPMALSAMNVHAGSQQGGAGLWMLTYPVALRYGLTVTADVDERHDDVRSTMVAGRYLKDLHARYGDWGTAIMAFACGPANVSRAQLRTGGATDYRTLYPHFTEGYQEVLPQLMAFIHLHANAEALGLEPIDVMPWEPADTLRTPQPHPLAAVAQVLQVPLGRIRSLNPTLCGGLIPADHPLLVPRGMGPALALLKDSLQRTEELLARELAAKATVPAEHLVSVVVQEKIRYKVRPGDSLGRIAEKHRVTVKQLKAWNNLRSDRINAGQTLVIHVKRRQLVKPSAEPEQQLPEDEGPVNKVAPEGTVRGSVQPPATAPFTSYTVQRGDSLYRIAQQFPGLTAQRIMEINGIGTTIRPGQQLKIPRP